MKRKHPRKRVNPRRIITTLTDTFQGTLKKPALKNTILTVIAIALSHTFRINEIASHLPVAVKTKKTKQKRLLRFIDSPFPVKKAMKRWLTFVLSRVYRTHRGHVLMLIDETDLMGGFKAIVAAIPFRGRAIPIYWHVYRDDEIRSMTYTSHNTLVQQFCTTVYQMASAALPQKSHPLLVFDRGFARAKYLMQYFKTRRIAFLIRVCKNAGLEVNGRVTTLKQMGRTGFYPHIVYHRTERIRLHLYVVVDDRFEDAMYIVSNCISGLAIYHCYQRRMQIEHGFRDIKTRFGFRSLVLKNITKPRVQRLWLLACFTYGLLFLHYQKSGYRWSKQFNSAIKNDSLITVIKTVIQEAWTGFCLSPFFSVPLFNGEIVCVSYGECFSRI